MALLAPRDDYIIDIIWALNHRQQAFKGPRSGADCDDDRVDDDDDDDAGCEQ